MFCSLSLLMFLFAVTILQLLCVKMSPVKVFTSPDKPSCLKLSVPDVPKPHVMPSAATAHAEVFALPV